MRKLGLSIWGGVLANVLATAGAVNAQTVELNFMFTGGTKAAILQEALIPFEQANPDIKVTLTNGASLDKIAAAIVSGSPPDLAYMHGGIYSVLGMKGLLRPLDPLLKTFGGFQVSDMAPGYEQLGIYDGVRYALPFWDVAPSYALAYNKSTFDSAGIATLDRTRAPRWSEVAAYNKKLTVIAPDGKIERVGLDPREAWNTRYYTIQTLFDVDFYTDGYKPHLDNNPQLVDALTFWKTNFVDPVPGFLSSPKASTAHGTSAMQISGTGLIGDSLQREIGSPVDATWAPQIDGLRAQRWRAWAIGIPYNSPHLPETMKLINYMMTNADFLNTIWDKGGAFTDNRDFLVAKVRQMPVLEQWFLNTVFNAQRIVVEDMSPMKNTMQDTVEAARDAIFSGEATPQAALAKQQAVAMAAWHDIYDNSQSEVKTGS